MTEIPDKLIDSIISEIELRQELSKLSDKDLVIIAITHFTDETWHPVVEVMMDRLYPNWDEADLNEKAPENKS